MLVHLPKKIKRKRPEAWRCFAQVLQFKALFQHFNSPSASIASQLSWSNKRLSFVHRAEATVAKWSMSWKRGSWMTPALVPTNQDADDGVFREAIKQEKEEDSLLKILLHVLPKTSAGALLSRGRTFIFLLFFSLRVFNFVKLSTGGCRISKTAASVVRQGASAFKQRVVSVASASSFLCS